MTTLSHLINIARRQNIDNYRRNHDPDLSASQRTQHHYQRQTSRLKESREETREKPEVREWSLATASH